MKITMFRISILRVAIVAIGAAALSALPAMAQDPATPPPAAGPQHGGRGGRMEGRQLDFLTKKLNLTPDQVTQIKAIDDDSMKQYKALHEDTSTAGQDRRAKMMEIRKASQDKIRGVLTDDQKTKYDALQAEMRERRESRGGGEGPPPPPAATPQQ
jgi:protein CpxP